MCASEAWTEKTVDKLQAYIIVRYIDCKYKLAEQKKYCRYEMTRNHEPIKENQMDLAAWTHPEHCCTSTTMDTT